ncbi:inverse autotransporter beta domain-containing protein [Xenorhabdus sp. XENO-7]|uniref:Inverse autotransporter beta domain-containing protein n=1 Tax=Xenorhabdus aichiensis TaxID=3025874 RepID=A0ABT5M843_9GAMM|nr:inverse autotransporter beta domain-containing protein [Xenorhabdus aichiensis]MDC9623866.1 inverse autotransporter beta domain-containing protein [Xenorhabdus aichiensis]
MPSFAKKIIGIFIFIYALLIPSTITSALAKGDIRHETSHPYSKETQDTPEFDAQNFIVNNLQTMSQVLSSSPSELKTQATSYALGKLNSTLLSETQKWLSQFGTVSINFGLDRDWKLKNHSLDFLLPLYDNKADWLFFSQLGYRNKDSRNTMNIGLGGRYFYRNWMYGLNTFYDYDITGKNRRIGLGSEIWGDYIKLSANAYHRLSDWQNSRNFDYYYERPANGYDINSEFYLPFYPNLGAKLSYEKYFGDSVTLFNRDTKQKNPSLAKIGLTYTPIPLFTIGVDYKQGESGRTETQFLANLNYRFGTPISTQLDHNNVASMRTLAGSRYDLVERNNNIVLEHKKIEEIELLAVEPILGYGHQEIKISIPVRSHKNIKQTSWKVADKAFEQYNGKFSSDSGKDITVTLPSYQEAHKQDYILDISITDNQERIKNTHMPIKVLPFLIDGKVKVIPPKSPESTGEEKNGYKFTDLAITYQGVIKGKIVKNGKIDNVRWIVESSLGDESELSFAWNNKPAQTNEKGELIDENGKLISNILVSKNKNQHDKVKVYIQLDGAPKQEIGEVNFDPVKPAPDKSEKIEVNCQAQGETPVLVNESYICTAIVTGAKGKDDYIIGKKVNWEVEGHNKLQPVPVIEQTNADGEATATLTSSTELSGLVVIASVDGQPANELLGKSNKINFSWPEITLDPLSKSTIDGDGVEHYTVRATVLRKKGGKVYTGNTENKEKDIKFVWMNLKLENGNNASGVTSKPSPGIPQSVDSKGKLEAHISGNQANNEQVKACINIEGRDSASDICSELMNFVQDFKIGSIEVINFNPASPLLGNGNSKYQYRAKIVDYKDNTKIIAGRKFEPKDISWTHDHNKIESEKLPSPELYSPTNKDVYTTDDKGYLYATLKSSVGIKNVNMTLKVSGAKNTNEEFTTTTGVEFTPIAKTALLYVYNENNKKVYKYFDNKDNLNRPSNVFKSLRGELRAPKNPKSFHDDPDVSEIIYSLKFNEAEAPYGGATLTFGDKDHGPIQFRAMGIVEIYSNVTMQSGEIQLYKYKIDIKSVSSANNQKGYVSVNESNIDCGVNTMGGIQGLYSDKEASDPTNPYSIHNEWGETERREKYSLYDWGLFEYVTGSDAEKATIIVKNTSSVSSKSFRVYDSKNNTFDQQSEGVIFCYQHLSNSGKN